MTPAQLYLLSEKHREVNDPKRQSDAYSNNTRRVVQVDPDDVRTPAILAGLKAMKPPARRK